MVLDVDARGFAVACAEVAVDAFVGIDDRLQVSIFRQEAQHGTYGADGVAVRASAAPGQYDEYHQRDGGDDEGGQALQPDGSVIECIAVGPLGQVGQQVVSPLVDGGEQVVCDASVRTVGGQQGHKRVYACHQCDDEHAQHAVTQPRQGRRIAVAVLLALLREPGNDVLEDAQRADDGTIDASQQQGENHQCQYHSHVERQHGREELNFGHPAEPCVQRPREVKEQQGDQRKKYDGQGQSDFT